MNTLPPYYPTFDPHESMSLQNNVPLSIACGLFILVGVAQTCLGQSPTESQSMTHWNASAPFAVGGKVRKVLPPIDCLRCGGPPACPPCNCLSRGFLYYGTNPCDDDCKNGFCECVNGECGSRAAQWSLWWINRRQNGHSLRPACRSCQTDCQTTVCR